MKVILNVRKGSAYAHLNGFSFNVATTEKTGITIVGINQEFPESRVFFNVQEIIIADLKAALNWLNTNESETVKEFFSNYFAGRKDTSEEALKRFEFVRSLKLQ